MRVWKEFIDNRGEGKCLYDFRFDRGLVFFFFRWSSLFLQAVSLQEKYSGSFLFTAKRSQSNEICHLKIFMRHRILREYKSISSKFII